jgi:hypothetical protein
MESSIIIAMGESCAADKLSVSSMTNPGLNQVIVEG